MTMMMTGLRTAFLFVTYGAIGFGGDSLVGLLSRRAHPERRVDVREIVVHPDVRVAVRVGSGDDCAFEADREVRIPASDLTLLHIDAGSGELSVEGREGLDEVVASGHLCASREEYLDGLDMTTDRVASGEVDLSAHYPDLGGRGGSRTAKIDLRVTVPMGLAVDIDDSSGSIDVRGTGALHIDDSSGSIHVERALGSVKLEDSSGGIEVAGVEGDLDIEDGSGSIEVSDVRGTVRLRDGSGGIEVGGVGQSVVVEADGSGGIDVHDVGGDFVVRRDGSGGVRYRDVRGEVSVPAKRRGH